VDARRLQVDRRTAAEAPRVVHERIESPEPPHHRRGQRGDLLGIGHVGREPRRAVRAELLDGLRPERGVASAQSDDRSLRRGRARDRPADPAIGAGDEHHAPLESEVHGGRS
jgi:hypothetical protein